MLVSKYEAETAVHPGTCDRSKAARRSQASDPGRSVETGGQVFRMRSGVRAEFQRVLVLGVPALED
jgi:hypothetical protein